MKRKNGVLNNIANINHRMGTDNIRFHIVVVGWNCHDYVDKCLQSILKQDYKNYNVIVVDDASTDDTFIKASKYGFEIIRNEKNMGAAYSRYIATLKGTYNDVICHLDLDDELEANALSTVVKKYKEGASMTYGNWKDQYGNICSIDINYSDKVHNENAYRKDAYRATHFRTFRKLLFDKISIDRHLINGKWPMSDTESETMFCCLELSGKYKIGVISDPIYIYNRRGKNMAVHRFGKEYQSNIYNTVISREPMKIL